MSYKAEIIGGGFRLETWAGDISDPDTCIDNLCNSTEDYHCIRITNERPSKMTAICKGDDTNDCLEFQIGSNSFEKWKKPYKNIFPTSHPASSIADRGAKIKVKDSSSYSETIITLHLEPSWYITGGQPLTLKNPPDTGFKVQLK